MKKEFFFNTRKYLYTLGIVVTASAICLVLLVLSSRGYFANPGKPISSDDIKYLCEKLPKGDRSLCNKKSTIYPKDISGLISANFILNQTDYQDVQEVLAPYRMKIDVEENLHFFVSQYDINKDGQFDVWMRFTGTLNENILDGILFREDIGF